MLQSIKYILFDFSDDFKEEFLNILKKAIWFLLIGIIAGIINEIAPNNVLDTISAFGLGIYAMFFGIHFFKRFASMSTVFSNVMLKWTAIAFSFIGALFFGIIYSIWGLIKLLVWFIIKQVKKNK